MSPERVEVEVDERRLTLSNLAKVLYPEAGTTKGEVLDYYTRIAEVMLPHLQDRPITLKRYPNGVEGTSFFEKHAPSHLPEWVRTVEVPSKTATHESVEFAVVDDRPSLIWAANLAALEFHVPLWRVGSGPLPADTADYLVFDLDPGPGTTIVECCRVARWITERTGQENVLAKTSGSKGLQLYRPLGDTSFESSSAQAHELARALEHDHPDAVVSVMRKELRRGKVLIDWSQNNVSKTTVAAYSLRARPTPTVSTPVSWDEVDRCAMRGDPDELRFEASAVLRRVDELGDLFAPLLGSERPGRHRRNARGTSSRPLGTQRRA